MTPHQILPRLKFVDHTDGGTGGATNAATIVPDRQFGVVRLISGASNETRTLARPERSGLFCQFDMVTDGGGDITLTVTGGYDEAGMTTMVFGDIGDYAMFTSVEEGSGTFVWRLVAYDGVSGPSLILGGAAFAGAVSVAGATTPTGGIAAAGGFSVSPRNMHTGDNPPAVSTDFTDYTVVNTEVIIAEVFVPANVTLTGVALLNGTAVAGNIKVGLANSAGAVVATSGSTGQVGANTIQRVPFTGAYAAVGPATYYVLAIGDTGGGTSKIKSHTIGNFGAAKQTGQVYATGFTTITPPTTFTTALGPVASLY